MWISFMSFVRASAVIGQLSEWALLALKRFPFAIACMVPLLGINILFNVYVEQRHSRISEFLPSEECFKFDRVRGNDDFSFVADVYKQPARKASDPVLPPNVDYRKRPLQEDEVALTSPA